MLLNGCAFMARSSAALALSSSVAFAGTVPGRNSRNSRNTGRSPPAGPTKYTGSTAGWPAGTELGLVDVAPLGSLEGEADGADDECVEVEAAGGADVRSSRVTT